MNMQSNVRCPLQARRAVGQRETALPAGGSTFSSARPERWRCRPGAKRWLVTGGGQQFAPQVEAGVEALPEGSDVTYASGGGAPLEGRAAVPRGQGDGDGRAAQPPGCVPAALFQGSSAGGPAEGAAGDS